MKVKFGMLEQTNCLRLFLCSKFGIDPFILLPSGGENPNFAVFLEFGVLWRH